MQDVNYLEELFLSTEIYGYFGPVLIVAIGVYVFRKSKTAGFLWILVPFLISLRYFGLAFSIDGEFLWHALITLFGSMFLCVYPFFDPKVK